MNVNDGLLSDKTFIIIFCLSMFFLCGAIYIDWSEAGAPETCLNKTSCVKHFIEITSDGTSKIAAIISLTILGFYATIFRSHQSGLTLRQAISNNTFKNYMEHKNKFNTIIKDFNEKNLDIHVDNAEKLYRKCFPSNNSKHFNPEASQKSDIVKIVKTHNEWINSALLFCQKLPGDLTTSQDDEHDKYILLIRDFQFILWEAGVDLKERVNISGYYFEALNNINEQNCNVLLKDPVSCINSYTSLLEKISSFCMLSDIYIEQLGLPAEECPLNVLGENLKEQEQDFVENT